MENTITTIEFNQFQKYNSTPTSHHLHKKHSLPRRVKLAHIPRIGLPPLTITAVLLPSAWRCIFFEHVSVVSMGRKIPP